MPDCKFYTGYDDLARCSFDSEEEPTEDCSNDSSCPNYEVWQGVVPCTGDRRCMLCGVLKSELESKED